MATTYSTLLGLAKPTTGELSGTWGDTVNNYLTDYLDAAVAGAQVISGSQTAVTLSKTTGSSLSQAGLSNITGSSQYQIIRCTGNPASLLTITAPATDKTYTVINATSTSQSVKIVGAGPTTGVTIASGKTSIVIWNGSDFVEVSPSKATNIAGGLANQIPYQTGAGTTSFVTAASTGYLYFNGTSFSWASAGSVTSVAMSVPAFLSVSGSPITSSGTLAVSLSGTALPVANGGTGVTTSTGTGNVVLSSNPTLTGYTETVYALSGTDINPANGTIQTKTLAANTTFTESIADGQSVILMLNPSTYTTTWPTMTWINSAGSGSAPTLKASATNVVVMWQVSSTVYGSWLGSN